MKPELLALSNIQWQLFCTLTFKRERMGEGLRRSMLFAWLRKLAGNFGIHFGKVIWCLRVDPTALEDEIARMSLSIQEENCGVQP